MAVVVALVGYDLIHALRALAHLASIVDLRRAHGATVLTLGLPSRLLRPRRLPRGRRSSPSSASSPATRSAGRSTSPTTRATSRRTSPVRKTFLWTYWGSALGAHLGDVPRRRARGRGTASEFDTIALHQGGGRPPVHRVRRDRAGLRRAGPGLGHRAEHVRRVADPDQRRSTRFSSVRPTLTRADHHHRVHRAALARRAPTWRSENFLANFEQLPAAGALLLHPVDGGQPGRLLHRPARATTRSPRSSTPTASTAAGAGAGSSPTSSASLAMVPFFSTGTLFTGPVAKAMQGADISHVHRPARGRRPVLAVTATSTSRPSSGSPSSRPPSSRRPPMSTCCREVPARRWSR